MTSVKATGSSLSGAKGEMTGANERTSAYYNRISEEIMQFASKVRDSEVRRDMLELAERFRRMARYVERRDPNRGGT